MGFIKAFSQGMTKASHGNPGIKIMAMSAVYLVLGFLVIHILTVAQAFMQQGVMAALGTLVFPFLAQMYWFIKSWEIADTPINWYCIVVFLYGLCVLVVGVLFRVVLKSGMCPNIEELKRIKEQNEKGKSKDKSKDKNKDNDNTYTYSQN